jgi:hypothetical protein
MEEYYAEAGRQGFSRKFLRGTALFKLQRPHVKQYNFTGAER